MTAVWILVGILLLWYCGKELRNSEPNWSRAINMVIFWPFSLFFKGSSKG
ncbi:hypothetical protein [Runella aurantiaca]|jgi:hypothetical protein|nr:hypothetical protein [Runella aurantiaca]